MPKKKNRSAKSHVPRALLVGIRTAGISAEATDESLDELARLVTTLGFEVVGRQVQRQRTTTGPTAIGAGKLTSLIHKTGKPPAPDEELADDDLLADVVVFDCELRPSQMRHIEGALRVEVMDRTGVIIEIFSRHAKTRTARLQVELARLNYLSPRIREVGSSGERQQGRGSGESALETERRRIRDRLAEIKKDLAALQRDQGAHREVRSEQRTVALVGYTNAGKSSTMRALTGSDVFVEDKLFATLDTTVRALKPETRPRILVTDTVGFIKQLPHDLVASFRSTLDEALHASLLCYVVDAGDPAYPEQLAVVDEVLKDVGVTETPVLLVFNKSDQLTELARKRLQRQYPDAIVMSALDKADLKRLRERLIKFFETELVDAEIFAPWENAPLQREIHARLKILRAEHGDEGIKFTVRADPALLKRILLRFGKKP